MTDKEQINDSLKNSDKNFNENCTHDKEQIIINGIDYTNALEDYLNDCIVDYCKSAHCDIEIAKDIILFPVAKQIEKLQQEKEKFKQECEELKKANQHIDTNRQCKGSKLKRIEELISDCETGYTDEFIQKIYGIIQEPEPTVNDYSITDRYHKALEEIEKIVTQDRNIKDVCLVSTCFKEDRIMYDIQEEILNIINKAKGERNV